MPRLPLVAIQVVSWSPDRDTQCDRRSPSSSVLWMDSGDLRSGQ